MCKYGAIIELEFSLDGQEKTMFLLFVFARRHVKNLGTIAVLHPPIFYKMVKVAIWTLIELVEKRKMNEIN